MKLKIGLSCSPSKILSHEKVKVIKVLVSWGGGMGGASESYYCLSIDKTIDTGKFWELTFLDGKTKNVNPTFVVSFEDEILVKVVSDITEHMNYRQKTCKKSITTEYILLYPYKDYEITNDYTARHDGALESKVVKRFSETEN